MPSSIHSATPLLLASLLAAGISQAQTTLLDVTFPPGTDPSDPASRLRITDLQDEPDELTVTWPSVAGRIYEVQWSSGLET